MSLAQAYEDDRVESVKEVTVTAGIGGSFAEIEDQANAYSMFSIRLTEHTGEQLTNKFARSNERVRDLVRASIAEALPLFESYLLALKEVLETT